MPRDADLWFEDQVAKAAQYAGYGGVPGLVEAFPTIAMTPYETRQWLIAVRRNEWVLDACDHVERATLVLQAWSPAQLYEATVDFFSNHLNVANGMVNTWCARGDYDRTVVRAHAFGKFRDMLVASSKHPAMLIYLENAYSLKDSLNENYGRELLELHTLGSQAGYTQADVVDSARAMTGRLVEFSRTRYLYNMNQRLTGPLRILGFTDPNTDARKGEAVGDRYLGYLATHPATATNLARQLCIRFVSDSPSTTLVEAVANAYLANDTAILPMLQTIVRSSEFWSSGGAKVRRPYEALAATLRAVGARPGPDLAATGATLSTLAGALGQRPLGWLTPNGYPDSATAWATAGAFSSQWRFQYNLVAGQYSSTLTLPDASTFVGGAASGTVSDALDAMCTSLLGQPPTDAARRAYLDYLGDDGTTPFRDSAFAGQTRAVAALMLHSPSHTVR